jgi:streptomycin 6-kinase
MTLRVPESLVEWHRKLYGQATRPWIEAAPGVVEELLTRWRLQVDGSATNGSVSLIVPVVREDGVRGVLKLPPPIEERFSGEPIALRAWNGDGAVRLLEHDPESGGMLLERLDASRSLATIPDDMEALEIVSELLARLSAIAAPPGVPLVSDMVTASASQIEFEYGGGTLDRVQSALQRPLPDLERSLLVRCSAALREVLPEPGDRLLHGDLGPGWDVLASEPDDPRGPWLAIDPHPLAGDPCFDLLPALIGRWDDAVATGDAHRAVQRRFDLMTDVVGLDRQRATAWTLGRVLPSMLWDIEHDATGTFIEHEAAKTIALTLLARHT